MEAFYALLSFCAGFVRHLWILLTKASEAELWCFLWSMLEQTVELTIESLLFETPSPLLWRHHGNDCGGLRLVFRLILPYVAKCELFSQVVLNINNTVCYHIVQVPSGTSKLCANFIWILVLTYYYTVKLWKTQVIRDREAHGNRRKTNS